MHRNFYWLALLTFLLSCILIYSGYTFYKIYQYDRLSQQVHVSSIQWSILAINDETFAPQASYQFQFQGSSYQGQTVWEETYLNAFAAQESSDNLANLKWKVWIDPDAPRYSSLQKTFPLKQSIYMIVLWVLTLYFIGLGRYVNSYYMK